MNAADQLAFAHERMTPEEIREHALQLARALEAAHGALGKISRSQQTLHLSVKRAHSLFVARKMRAGRQLVYELAEIDEFAGAELPDIDELFRPFPERTHGR